MSLLGHSHISLWLHSEREYCVSHPRGTNTKVEILCQFWWGFNVYIETIFCCFLSVNFHLRKEYKFVTLKHFVKIYVVMCSKCPRLLFTQRNKAFWQIFLEEKEYILMFLNLPSCEIAVIQCSKTQKAPSMSQGLCQVLEVDLDLRYHPCPQGAFNAVGKKDKEMVNSSTWWRVVQGRKIPDATGSHRSGS